MADIVGTPNPDILDGTNDPDVITGLGGNDTLNGFDGNDTLNGGAGTDILNGGEGDDTLISDDPSVTDRFDGGNGFDTIRMQYSGGPGTLLSQVFSAGTTFASRVISVERLQFGSQVGQSIIAQFNAVQFFSSGIVEVEGGAGRDQLAIIVSSAGSYTLSGITFSGGWAAAPVNAWDAASDIVALSASTPGNVTLTASNGIAAMQTLRGSAGNDVLVGSSNADRLDGNAGVNQLFGNGGNDVLAITNQIFPIQPPTGAFNPPTTFNGAGGIYDGGDGTDVLSIGGYVNFQGTLLNVEGVLFQPEFFSANPATVRQARAQLELDSAHAAMLPSNAFFIGTGDLIIRMDDGASFDGSGYTFNPGSNVSVRIIAGDGAGVNIVGTSNGDSISFGGGVQTATGGTGEDIYTFPDGIATITDFTGGEDTIDLNGTGLSSMERLADFLTDTAGGARIAADSGGQHYELNLSGVSATGLSPDDFIFDFGSGPTFIPGTELDDVLFGFGFNDIIHGGDGNDRIYSGGGIDQIFGDAGDDTVVIDGAIQFGFPQPTFNGGTGFDTLVIRPGSQVPTPFGDLVSFAGALLGGFEAVKFDSVAGVTMRTIIGDWQMAGITTVIGGAGSDSFIISANLNPTNTYTIPVLNLVNWGSGDLVVLAVGTGTANTTLNSIAHSGVYVLSGNTGNDTFNGSSGIEVMIGGGGDDTFTSGGGGDQIDGGDGTDTALFAGAFSAGRVSVSPVGQLFVDGSSYSNVESFVFDGRKYHFDGTGLVPDNSPPAAFTDSASVDEDAIVIGNVLANDSTGEADPAADHIVVTTVDGMPVGSGLAIQGLYGMLTIAADGSYSYVADADLLDALPAGTQLNESFAYTIADELGETASSTLTINVTTVNDLVSQTFGNGNDTVTGTDADEVIDGGRGDDRIDGGAGSDRIYGGLGADVLSGGAGWDLLSGGNGNDRLSGGTGDDVLAGGKGVDMLTGGLGADVFEFGFDGTDRDTITDFEVGIDHIHLASGVTITGMSATGGSTLLTLSTGGSVLLSGVTGVADPATLVTTDLPHWSADLML